MSDNPFDKFAGGAASDNPFDKYAAAAPPSDPTAGRVQPDYAEKLTPKPTPQLEYPDAPTTGRLELPGMFGKDGLSFGAKAATLFGPMLTDSPRARQEIYAKHLPGAKAFDDKHGNPMIEYKGEKYYTSRPGEFDAADAGRVGLGVAASVPLMAAALPAGVAGMVATGAAIGGAQSLGEDALTRAAGGESQPIDLPKAGINAAISAAIPPVIQKAVAPLARRAYAAVQGPLVTEAGNLTAAGERIIGKAGIDTSNLTIPQMKLLEESAHNNFGNPQAIARTARQAQGDEFNVRQTTGQLTGDESQLIREDQMRQGQSGGGAKATMRGAQEDQTADLLTAQGPLRQQLSGSPQTLDASTVGSYISQNYTRARNAAKGAVRDLYTRAFDPERLKSMGIPNRIRIDDLKELPATLDRAFYEADRPGGAIYRLPQTTPSAAAATNFLDQFSRSGSLSPNATTPPGTVAIGWQQLDAARKVLSGLYNGAKSNPTDRMAMGRILDVFDEHFGKLNPMLNDARAAHVERVKLFDPQRTNAAGVDPVLKNLAVEANPGQTIYNRLFNSGSIKAGEAGPIISKLRSIFGVNHPEGLQALREGALNRLMVDAQGLPLSPQRLSTSINTALKGQQSEIYESLFNAGERAQLQRYADLSGRVAQNNAPINASKSGYQVNALLKKGAGAAVGVAAGETLGRKTGIPGAGHVLGAAGGATGHAFDRVVAAYQAQRAVSRAGMPGPTPPPSASPGAYAGPLAGLTPIDMLARSKGLLGPDDQQ